MVWLRGLLTAPLLCLRGVVWACVTNPELMTVRRSKKATCDFMAETPWIEAIDFGRIISRVSFQDQADPKESSRSIWSLDFSLAAGQNHKLEHWLWINQLPERTNQQRIRRAAIALYFFLKNCPSHSCCFAASFVSNIPWLPRLPDLGSFLCEYNRYLLDFNFLIIWILPSFVVRLDKGGHDCQTYAEGDMKANQRSVALSSHGEIS